MEPIRITEKSLLLAFVLRGIPRGRPGRKRGGATERTRARAYNTHVLIIRVDESFNSQRRSHIIIFI